MGEPSGLVVDELFFQAVGGEMAEDGGEAGLGGSGAVLGEGHVGFVARVPGRPLREAWAVRVAGLREVGPVGLDGVSELVVGFGEGKPVEHSILEGAEDVRDFEGVEGAELGFSFAGDGAIETIDESAMAGVGGEGCLRAGGAGGADVVACLVDCGSAVHHDAGSVGGDRKICPMSVERAGEIGEDLEFVGHAGLGAGGWILLCSGFGDYAEGGELAGVEAGEEVDGEEFCRWRRRLRVSAGEPSRRFRRRWGRSLCSPWR